MCRQRWSEAGQLLIPGNKRDVVVLVSTDGVEWRCGGLSVDDVHGEVGRGLGWDIRSR